jgi:hypothetical protein
MPKARILVFLLCFLVSVSCCQTAARAACAGPTGNAGDMIYNQASHVPQYCNGLYWIVAALTGDVTSGLVGYWKFDEGTGTSAADSTGNGNTGTLTNSPTWQTGQYGNAVNFDGSNDYVSVPDPGAGSVFDFANGTSITVAAWVNLTSLPQDAIVLSKGATGGADNANYQMEIATNNHLYLSFTSGGVWQTAQSTATVPVSGWHHYVVSQTFGSASLQMYIDGAVIASDSGDTSAPDVTNVALWFGADNEATAGATDNELNGKIDEARVYNRVLSAAEVSRLYNYQVPTFTDVTSGRVGWWKLDDASGGSASDSSGSGNTGTLTNGPTWTTGRINGAVNFDGGNDRIDLGSNLSILQNVSQASLTAWVNANSFVAYPVIVANSIGNGAATSTSRAELFLNGSNVSCGGRAGDGESEQAVITTAALNGGTWYHLACLIDYANDTATVYINGVAQAMTGTISFTAGSTANTASRSNAIGAEENGGSNWFDGKIDDVRIYNRALTANEVSQIYGGSTGTCGAPAGNEGDMMYNGDYEVVQYCDGRNWVAMGPVPGSGGAGCSSPSGVRGEVMFNDDYALMQYCDGTDWQQIGTPVQATTNGLVGYWKLDESAGATTAVDSSGNGNDGTKNGTTNGGGGDFLAAQVNNGFNFEYGNTNYFDVGNPASLQITGSLTIAAWFKLESVRAGSSDDSIFDKVSSLSDKAWQFKGSEDCGSERLQIDLSSDGSDSIQRCSSTTLSTGTWYHGVGVYDASAQTLHVYLNGVLNDGTLTGAVPTSIHNSTGNAYIANKIVGGLETFDGVIDDVRVYNRALSAAEICTLYKVTGGGGSC